MAIPQTSAASEAALKVFLKAISPIWPNLIKEEFSIEYTNRQREKIDRKFYQSIYHKPLK